MNANESRGGDMAELARLSPAPAERDLPAGRQHTLKEHLMSELRLAASPPAGGPARSRRRRRWPVFAIPATGAIVLAAALGVTFAPTNTPAASPGAVRLLAKVATAAAHQPSPAVHDNQFWYVRSWDAYESCYVYIDSSRNKCVLQKPHERQVWQSVSNLCVTGLLREYGQNTTLNNGSGEKCPYRGDVHDPTYRFLQALPTDPQALLNLIEQQMQGGQPRPQEAFTTIGDLLGESIVPPKVSAALYRAAALIPGVTVVADATDAVGRHGVAVAMVSQGGRSEWIFSKKTFRYLGERDVAKGSVTGVTAVLQRAFVDHPGQIPG